MIKNREKLKVKQEFQLDPWTLFLNAMRAPMTRRYQTRLVKFFDFIGIPRKTLEQRQRSLPAREKMIVIGHSLKF